jgi:hypothetical protein
MRTAALAFLVGVAASAWSGPALAQSADGVVREGEGSRRTQLNARERKPFDHAAWGGLTDWKNGPAPSAATTTGRPVLIVTWTDYIPVSKRALALAVRLAGERAGDGLIVVCAHGKDEWASAQKPEAPKGGTLLLAHDSGGAFRSAILSDNDPDFYVIDRAGQLRFADIVTDSVESAVATVCAETREQAAGLNQRLAHEARVRDTEVKRAEALRAGVDLRSLPEVPFEKPGDGAYESAKWPKLPEDPQQQFQAQGPDDKPQPQKITIPDTGWYPAKPNLEGRVVFMYFWHPDAPQSFRSVNSLDFLQKQQGRDIVVVGVIAPLFDRTNSGTESRLEMDPEKLQKKLEDSARTRKLDHPILLDPQGTLFQATKTYYQSFQQAIPLPWIAIVSTDSYMRWWGPAAMPGATGAFDRVLAVDPGVQARRKAEEEYIKARQGR